MSLSRIPDRAVSTRVEVGMGPESNGGDYILCYLIENYNGLTEHRGQCSRPLIGRYVRLRRSVGSFEYWNLFICEVRVYGYLYYSKFSRQSGVNTVYRHPSVDLSTPVYQSIEVLLVRLGISNDISTWFQAIFGYLFVICNRYSNSQIVKHVTVAWKAYRVGILMRKCQDILLHREKPDGFNSI